MTEFLPKKFLALMLLVINVSLFSQNCGFLGTDIQGNSYSTLKNEIIKVSANNAGTFRISNKLLGDIHTIDVRNPMRPILFYKDVQKMIITDNTLSEQNQSVISFEELGMYQITCVASSKIDNGIWLYDQELFQIVKVDQYLQKKIETGNLMQILNLKNLEPIKMIEANGYLYMQCINNGILVFDIYGTYYKKIPIGDISNWNVQNNQIYYTTDEFAKSFNLQTLEITELVILDKKHPIWIEKSMVYFCEGSKIIQQALK